MKYHFLVAASCLSPALDTQKPQSHRISLSRAMGAAVQRAEGPGMPLRPSLPPPGCAEVGEAGSGSLSFWLHFLGPRGLRWWESGHLGRIPSSPRKAEFEWRFLDQSSQLQRHVWPTHRAPPSGAPCSTWDPPTTSLPFSEVAAKISHPRVTEASLPSGQVKVPGPTLTRCWPPCLTPAP